MVGILDVVWISCIIVDVGLFFLRKLILCEYHCPTGLKGYLFPWFDARMLREIAETEDSEELRVLCKWINILIPALFIGGIFVMMLSVVIRPTSLR